jgi:membrane-associated protease RseP (regulator of RpoE activity)
MKNRFILTLAALTLFTLAAFAGEPIRRTIIVKDGKVIKDGQVLELGDRMLMGRRAYLGVTLVDLTPELRSFFGVSGAAGVLVSSVEEGGPADKAGVRVGDVIVSLDGKDIASSWDLRSELSDRKSGDAARLEVIRSKTRQSVVATVAEREGPQMLRIEEIEKTLGEHFSAPEWKARIESRGDCGELQTRIRDLESRLKDLEKKLQK